MNDDTAREIMARFGRAFFRRDAGLLGEVLTEDAQWHFAFGPDAPDGRVRHGVEGFLRGADENDAMFERLRFEDVECRALGPERIVMTYRLEGARRGGEAFSLRGVELVDVRDGRIAKKDVFWKQMRFA